MRAANPVAARLATVAPFGVGASGIGNLYRTIDDAAARATVNAAWQAGVRYFDTAPFYGFGLSERRLGDALRDRPRDAFLLSTKTGRLLRPSPSAELHGFCAPLPFRPEFDYSYDGVMRSFEDSLQRLGLDRIDILLMHDLGALTHGLDHQRQFAAAMNGGMRAMVSLRAQGLVGAIGLGVNEIAVCRDALAHADLDMIMLAGRYTLLEQEPLDGFFAECRARDVLIVAAGVFNSGILATGSAGVAYYDYSAPPPDIIERVRRIEVVCAKYGVPLAAAALRFATSHPVVAAAVVGVASADEVARLAEHARAKIPSGLWDDLRDRGLIPPDAPTPDHDRENE